MPRVVGFYTDTDGQVKPITVAGGSGYVTKRPSMRRRITHKEDFVDYAPPPRTPPAFSGAPDGYSGWTNWDTWETWQVLESDEQSSRNLQAWAKNFQLKQKHGKFDIAKGRYAVAKYLVPKARKSDPDIDPNNVNLDEIVHNLLRMEI